MRPQQMARNYDHIASWWKEQMKNSDSGILPLKKAIQFTKNQGYALDVGCGSEGRFIRLMLQSGFHVEGLDISPKMITLAKKQHPYLKFYTDDICTWEMPRKYSFITAWDSTFHLPLNEQKPVLNKLCQGLTEGGILMFTFGEGEMEEISGSFAGETFEYSTLGRQKYLDLLSLFGCQIKHLEYDQYPENHIYVVAQKIN
ncbi:MAG: class I SAM-dependent methyltransferase [Cyanobacteria bacterium J06621_8]